MPVHKVLKDGKIGFQWGGHGKVYFGKDAEKKASAQGQAAHAAGYKEPKKKNK